jgi:outer membrane protein
MKKVFILASALALTLASAAFADTKIAVLDLNKVLASSPQVTDMQAQLKKQFDPRGQELVKMQKGIQSEIDQYNKNSPKMKSDELKKSQDKIIAEQKKLQEQQNTFQSDLVKAQNQSMQTILKKVEDIVNKIAADQKFDLVVTKVSTAYNDPKLEITDQVIAEIKK